MQALKVIFWSNVCPEQSQLVSCHVHSILFVFGRHSGCVLMPFVEGRPEEGGVNIHSKSVNSLVKPIDRVWLTYFSRMKLDHGAVSYSNLVAHLIGKILADQVFSLLPGFNSACFVCFSLFIVNFPRVFAAFICSNSSLNECFWTSGI